MLCPALSLNFYFERGGLNLYANANEKEAEEIYKLTSLCTFEDRFVIPPMYREQAIEMMKDPHEHREETGFGFVGGPRRGM